MSELVRPGGHLIVITLPGKKTGNPGPPYVTSIDMISGILATNDGIVEWRCEEEFLSNPVGLEPELLVVWRRVDG
jgi:hypothetical protein